MSVRNTRSSLSPVSPDRSAHHRRVVDAGGRTAVPLLQPALHELDLAPTWSATIAAPKARIFSAVGSRELAGGVDRLLVVGDHLGQPGTLGVQLQCRASSGRPHRVASSDRALVAVPVGADGDGRRAQGQHRGERGDHDQDPALHGDSHSGHYLSRYACRRHPACVVGPTRPAYRRVTGGTIAP